MKTYAHTHPNPEKWNEFETLSSGKIGLIFSFTHTLSLLYSPFINIIKKKDNIIIVILKQLRDHVYCLSLLFFLYRFVFGKSGGNKTKTQKTNSCCFFKGWSYPKNQSKERKRKKKPLTFADVSTLTATATAAAACCNQPTCPLVCSRRVRVIFCVIVNNEQAR